MDFVKYALPVVVGTVLFIPTMLLGMFMLVPMYALIDSSYAGAYNHTACSVDSQSLACSSEKMENDNIYRIRNSSLTSLGSQLSSIGIISTIFAGMISVVILEKYMKKKVDAKSGLISSTVFAFISLPIYILLVGVGVLFSQYGDKVILGSISIVLLLFNSIMTLLVFLGGYSIAKLAWFNK